MTSYVLYVMKLVIHVIFKARIAHLVLMIEFYHPMSVFVILLGSIIVVIVSKL